MRMCTRRNMCRESPFFRVAYQAPDTAVDALILQHQATVNYRQSISCIKGTWKILNAVAVLVLCFLLLAIVVVGAVLWRRP